MAIQMRRGANSDFSPSKMLPGEIAVTTDGTRKVYAAFAPGDVKELASTEEVQEIVDNFDKNVEQEIEDAKNAVIEEAEEQVQKVINKAYEVLESIPDDYEELAKQSDEAVRTKADAIVCTVSGVNPIAKDSSNDYLRNLKLYGKTTQGDNPSTSNPQPLESKGKWGNLLENTAENTTRNGVSLVVNSDKSITLNGTPTETTYFGIGSMTYIANKEYKLSGCPSGGGSGAYSLQANYYNESGTQVGASDYGSTKTYIPSKADSANVYIVVVKGVAINNLTFYPQITYAEDNITTYRPYSGQMEIESAVLGGNLLPYPWYSSSGASNGVTFTDNGDGSLTLNGTATPSYPTMILVDDWKPSVGIYSKSVFDNVKFIVSRYIRKTNTYDNVAVSEKTITFDTSNWDYDVYCYKVIVQIAIGVTLSTTIFPMINKGDILLPWTPYSKQPHISLVSDGLKGIPVTDASLATYTDENGVMWCSDYVDCERGVLVQRVGVKNLADATYWSHISSWVNERAFYNEQILSDAVTVNGYSTIANIMSNRFIVGTPSLITKDENKIGQGANTLYLSVDGITTKEELVAYFAENETLVYYILADPIETPLSADEIASYKALHSNYKVTSVMNDCEAFMEVQYNADTKLYIDNKFTELAEKLLA